MTKDRIKEEIGLYKLLMAIVSAIFSSIASWLWKNYTASDLEIKILLILSLIFLLITILFLFFEINNKIKKLDYYD